jgi:hypothetical protein
MTSSLRRFQEFRQSHFVTFRLLCSARDWASGDQGGYRIGMDRTRSRLWQKHGEGYPERTPQPRLTRAAPKRLHDLVHIDALVDGIDLGKGDLACRIHDERGALADAGNRRPFAQDAEFARHFGMWIEIGTHCHLDRSDFIFSPCDVAVDRIYADVQNLGIERRELLFSGIEFGHLRRSSRSPVERMKRHDQILAAQIVARAHNDPPLASYSRELEIGREIASL